MKTRFFLSILSLGIIVSAFGQKPTMELTFTAENNGQYIPLDSIFIENLTQGGDTTLYAPDTMLSLEYNTGVNDIHLSENTFFVSQNYPNPFNEQTTINIYLPEKEQIEITILDILGRKVASFDNILKAGNHLFTFYSGKDKYYLFSVTGKYTSKTIKMLNINSNPTHTGQCKIVYAAYDENGTNYKSQHAIDDFVFEFGDHLRYIGYAKTINEVNGSAVIEDAPENSVIYEFEITEGIPCRGIPTVTYEGQTYNTLQIGSQCWFKENLNVGTKINGNEDMADNGVLEKYCYDDTTSNCNTYGGLYQWGEMMQYVTTPGAEGICPTGWHIPTYGEWGELVDYLGGWSVAGGKMKEAGYEHWNSPNTGATNISGFTCLPGGSRNNSGGPFYNLGKSGLYWSSSENSSYNAKAKFLYYTDVQVWTNGYFKTSAHSVRCLRN